MSTRKIGTISWQKFERVLLQLGCEFVSEKGDHRKYKKKGLIRPIIVPRQKNLAPFIVKNNLRILGVSNETFFEILDAL